MREKLNKKINDALGSIDDIQRAAAPDFFYTRLEGRMLGQKNFWEKISSFITRPSIAFACIAIIVLMNSWIIFSNINNEKNDTQQNTELATVDEYSMVSSSLYEFENSNP